jgi:hypothetical protein
LKSNGDTTAALAKYRAAQTALNDFKKAYADWNAKIVTYRAKTIADKIGDLTGETVPASGTTGATETRPAQAASKAAAASGQTVKLVEPGAEPRSALRLHPKAGDKQTVLLTMKLGMDVQMGDTQNPPMKLPPMVMTMESTIKDVAPNGDITYETVITDATTTEEAGTMPQIADAMKTALGGMKGLSGSGTTTSRGISKKTDMKAPPTSDPQVKQIIDQMKDTFANLSTPFPEEPIGAGAKWEVRQPIKSQGMTMTQACSYQLVSTEGDKVATKTTITQSAANQKVQNPSMPGLKMDLTKMTGKGSGDVTFDLGQLMAREATLELHSEMQMVMGAPQKTTIGMKMDINLHLETK